MNKKIMKKYKDMLLSQKKEIIDELIKDNEEYSDLKEENIGDMADAAYSAYEKDLIVGMSQKEQIMLEKINAALERIEQNEFGKCISCFSVIEDKRLDIMPYALKCIECQKKDEKNSFTAEVDSPT